MLTKSMVLNVFAIYSQSKIQNIFSFLHIPLAIHSDSEIGVSFSITDLAQTKFMFCRFSFFFWHIVFMLISIDITSIRLKEGWLNAN